MGCARIAFQSANGSGVFYKEHFICNYGPTGNIPGQTVYKIGEPCSACPEGTACTVEYPGLCGSETVFAINYKKPKKSDDAEDSSGSALQYAFDHFCISTILISYGVIFWIPSIRQWFIVYYPNRSILLLLRTFLAASSFPASGWSSECVCLVIPWISVRCFTYVKVLTSGPSLSISLHNWHSICPFFCLQKVGWCRIQAQAFAAVRLCLLSTTRNHRWCNARSTSAI